MSFLASDKEELLLGEGWVKEYESYYSDSKEPGSYLGMQSWKRYEDYNSYELRISYRSDGRHLCGFYLDNAKEAIEFRIRSIRSMLGKFNLLQNYYSGV